MVEVVRTNFSAIFRKTFNFLPILARIVVPPNNLVQNDADPSNYVSSSKKNTLKAVKIDQ